MKINPKTFFAVVGFILIMGGLYYALYEVEPIYGPSYHPYGVEGILSLIFGLIITAVSLRRRV